MLGMLKYLLRGAMLALESRFTGRRDVVNLPNGKTVIVRSGLSSSTSLEEIVAKELVPYWEAHHPAPGEVHLDVGAQIGSYSMLAASSNAIVYALEPDPNNRRFLKRNLSNNHLSVSVTNVGAWNAPAILSFRSHGALSSIKGVGTIPTTLPFHDQIKVDRIDHIVKSLGIEKVDVIKMDIEGAEIEALEGARETILKDRPVLLIEAYHIRDGQPTLERVLAVLRNFGVSDNAVVVTAKTLVVVRNY